MADFFPTPTVITIRDRKIEIKPIPVKNLSKVAKLVSPIISEIGSGSVSLSTIIENADNIIELSSLVCNIDKEWVGELDASELLQIIMPVVEVNIDFFVHKMAPELEKVAQRISQIGQTS